LPRRTLSVGLLIAGLMVNAAGPEDVAVERSVLISEPAPTAPVAAIVAPINSRRLSLSMLSPFQFAMRRRPDAISNLTSVWQPLPPGPTGSKALPIPVLLSQVGAESKRLVLKQPLDGGITSSAGR